ncbi:glycosyltransferase [Pseudarthrobacter sp. H2]|uniref:glycosyltransferase n=1 Tax=Pseudarthrobacter sp. H2 TaxID=3418415 RepID=UPI003CF379FB
MPGLGRSRKIWGPVGSSDARLESPQSLVTRALFKVKKSWFRFLGSRVDLVVAQTGSVARKLEGLAVAIVVEQNCVVADGVTDLPVRSTRARQNERPRVAIVGVLTDRKRPQLAIDALRATGKGRWELVVMGDGPLREQLESKNRDLMDEGLLRFTGWLSHDQAQIEVAGCVGLIHSSVREGAPWAIAEALTQGKWVVTIAGNGADYLVGLVSGGGMVVSNDEPELGQAVGAAVIRLLDSGDHPGPVNRWAASRFGALLHDWYLTV